MLDLLKGGSERIDAYGLDNRPGELKVGQTTRDVKRRVEEQTKTAR